MIRSPLFLLLALALLLAGCVDAPMDPAARAPAEPHLGQGAAPPQAAGDRIPGQYIVVFKPGVGNALGLAQALVQAHGGTRLHSYQHALKGFAARLSPQAAEALSRNPNVAYVEQDVMVFPAYTVQSDAPWGLDRIDQRDLPLSTTYSYTADGTGVTVYVIDTGIRFSHGEFGGRASNGHDFVLAEEPGNTRPDQGPGEDCHGHGTHVAGTVGGATYGVAKQVQLVSVRVFGCTGGASKSRIIAAVDWVTADHLARRNTNPQASSVANMSLQGPGSDGDAYRAALRAMIAAGVVTVAAAGNNGANACHYLPAGLPEAITVGATTASDARSSFSNWGTCVDIFAPGVDIPSAWWTSDGATHAISGTSMAVPHVAGVAALYLQSHPSALPAQVTSAILSAGTAGRVTDPGTGSPNRLLYSTPSDAHMTTHPPRLELLFLQEGDSLIWPTSNTAGVQLSYYGADALGWSATTDRPWLSVSPGAGSLPANGGSTQLTLTADYSALGPGPHTGAITITAPAAGISPHTLPVGVRVLPATRLQLNAPPITGLSGTPGHVRAFLLEIGEGVEDLEIRTDGGTGNADLYAHRGPPPMSGGLLLVGSFDCRSQGWGNTEICFDDRPSPGTYFVLLVGGFAGLTLEARATLPSTPTTSTLALEPATQQYSDRTRLRASISPAQASGSVQFQRSTNGGVSYADLGSPVPVAGGSAALDYPVTEAAGADVRFRALFTGTGSYGNSTSGAQQLTINREDATVLYASGNPAALQVSMPGGSLNAGDLSLSLLVREKEPDVAVSPGTPGIGNIAYAGLSLTLLPAGPGSSHTLLCTPGAVTGSGYAATRSFTCTNSSPLPVNSYELQAEVTGSYYTGSYTDVFTVYDPSLGFATGGGTFRIEGERVNFGFTLRYNPNGANLRGNFLAVRHHADGTTSRLKSNALGSLALGADASVPMGWTSFDGRATFTRWDAGAGAYVTVGNQSFAVYAEDRGGAGADRIWMSGPGGLRMPGTLATARSEAVELTGGNIAVPR